MWFSDIFCKNKRVECTKEEDFCSTKNNNACNKEGLFKPDYDDDCGMDKFHCENKKPNWGCGNKEDDKKPGCGEKPSWDWGCGEKPSWDWGCGEKPNDTINPETPETPSIPNEPEVSETPSIPNEPEVSETPSVPNEPEVSETPSIPNEPEISETPSMPNEPETSETPNNPNDDCAELPDIEKSENELP